MYFESFLESIKQVFPAERILQSKIQRMAYSTDASHYTLFPKLVLKADTEKEVQLLLQIAKFNQVSITFRGAGTSLVGQALSDSVIVILTPSWKKSEYIASKNEIWVEPALTGSEVNHLLIPYSQKIGPDPSSIDAAHIGGILANNASGMCCGVKFNSYHTLKQIRVLLEDGTLLDTADKKNIAEFRRKKADLLANLMKLKTEILASPELIDLIRRKYLIKNTMGYAINSFLDFEDPIDILKHLFVGSEGTLGFIAKACFSCFPDLPHKSVGFFILKDIKKTTQLVQALQPTPVDAVELLDYLSLQAVIDRPIMKNVKLPNDQCAALLIQTSATSKKDLAKQEQKIFQKIQLFQPTSSIFFTSNKTTQFTELWELRKGLYPSVGAMRSTGSTAFIEDVAFPIQNLDKGVLGIQKIIKECGYKGVIFGHALAGNIHFVISQSFESKKEIKQFEIFNEKLAALVFRYQGSLKAEHGTGRNTAPFVEKEWGNAAYCIMQRLKKIMDPQNILNPGVLLNEDKKIYLKNFKTVPPIDALLDKCTECGFCERICPSVNITFSPRQRISVLRNLQSLEAAEKKTLLKSYNYFGEATCTSCGLCQSLCPMQIDTGVFIRKFRSEKNSPISKKLAGSISKNFSTAKTGIKITLSLLEEIQKTTLTKDLLKNISRFAKKKLPTAGRSLSLLALGKNLPLRTKQKLQPKLSSNLQKIIYFPSCISQTILPTSKIKLASLVDTTIEVLERAGYQVILLPNYNRICCGKAFESKGYKEAADYQVKKVEKNLKLLGDKTIPLLCDTSPCSMFLKEKLNKKGWNINDSIEILDKYVLSKLKIKKKKKMISIHPVCSLYKMGLDERFKKIASLLSTEVIIPPSVSCCGVAGDKIFQYPELVHSALSKLASEIPKKCKEGYSSSTTCELGLNYYSPITYRSIFYLINELTKTK